jgi:hypothetical protein
MVSRAKVGSSPAARGQRGRRRGIIRQVVSIPEMGHMPGKEVAMQLGIDLPE